MKLEIAAMRMAIHDESWEDLARIFANYFSEPEIVAVFDRHGVQFQDMGFKFKKAIPRVYIRTVTKEYRLDDYGIYSLDRPALPNCQESFVICVPVEL